MQHSDIHLERAPAGPPTLENRLRAARLRRAGRKAGFSLAEIMIVILIIGLLATKVVPSLLDSFGSAQTGVVKSDLMAIDAALTQYVANNAGRYPESLQSLVDKDVNGKRLLDRSKVPADPWGNEYVYEPPRGTEDHVLMTLGKDGQIGGEGDDRDIDVEMVKNGDA